MLLVTANRKQKGLINSGEPYTGIIIKCGYAFCHAESVLVILLPQLQRQRSRYLLYYVGQLNSDRIL